MVEKMFFGSMHGDEESGYGKRHHDMFHPGRIQVGMREQFQGFGHDSTRRFMRPVVMLLLAEQPMHGYELLRRLKDFGIAQGGMDPSLLYRLLRVMERAELAESSLDDSGSGPARKVYSLTPDGMEVLDLWAANLDDVAELLQRFKERYQKLGR
jgi:PadR family transcriptional regulator PadR